MRTLMLLSIVAAASAARTEKRGLSNLGTYGAVGGLAVGSALSVPAHGLTLPVPAAPSHDFALSPVLHQGAVIRPPVTTSIIHTFVTKQVPVGIPHPVAVPVITHTPYPVPKVGAPLHLPYVAKNHHVPYIVKTVVPSLSSHITNYYPITLTP